MDMQQSTKFFWKKNPCADVNNSLLLMDEFYELIKDNIWVNYFKSVRFLLGENWIDFESEISDVINQLDDIIDTSAKNQDPRYNVFTKRYSQVLPDYRNVQVLNDIRPRKNFIDSLYSDLNKLIRALEIYIAGVVENIPVKQRLSVIEKDKFDIVISFNYTNTFKRLYQKDLNDKQICYIHGKAMIDNSVDSCNMVLGVQESLNPDSSNESPDLLVFKKYYQRIYKKTDSQYLDWTLIAESAKDHVYDIVVLGHSLDVTDQEILKPFIISKSCKVKIYHHDKKTMGSHIKNLLEFVDHRDMIKKTGGKMATIEFVDQDTE